MLAHKICIYYGYSNKYIKKLTFYICLPIMICTYFFVCFFLLLIGMDIVFNCKAGYVDELTNVVTSG